MNASIDKDELRQAICNKCTQCRAWGNDCIERGQLEECCFNTCELIDSLLDKLEAQAEEFYIGMDYSTPTARAENGVVKAVPISALNQLREELK